MEYSILLHKEKKSVWQQSFYEKNAIFKTEATVM